MNAGGSDHSGSLETGLYIVLSVLPCALSIGSYTWPILAAFVIAGGVRLRYADPKALQDSLLFGIVNVVLLRKELLQVVGKSWHTLGWPNGLKSYPLSVLIALAACGLSLQYIRGRNKGHHPTTKRTSAGVPNTALEHPKALVFPCQTTHARVFPKKHAFGYTYLLCGFPVLPVNNVEDGLRVHGGENTLLGSWWLQIRAEDYLDRGQGYLGFYGKLKQFLTEHDVPDSEWSYAYLVTAPRFFGYSFNPVSFWYIYSADDELKRMILEVNNTFGERRIYLLDGSGLPESSTRDTKSRFSDIWVKDFHVSPFNSRKGSYALKALNPFPYPKFANPKIDNTITLKSSKDHGKLVARVHTTGEPLDFEQLGPLATLRFIVGWWWVGLVTFPRIIREAIKLYFRRSLHVWFRPEVLSSSIGRAPAVIEVALQRIFKDYLLHLVNHSPDAFNIEMETAIPCQPKQTIARGSQVGSKTNGKRLDLRISTPAFYSRFVHYAHTSEALDRECLFTDEKNRTLWISSPSLLTELLPKRLAKSDGFAMRTYVTELRWRLLKKLRCAPSDPAYTLTPKSPSFDVDDIRALPYSDLDNFVRGSNGCEYAGAYRRMVTKIFFAQRYAFGFVEVIDMVDFLIRLLLCWYGARTLVCWAQVVELHGGLSAGEAVKPLQQSPLSKMDSEWRTMSIAAAYLCGCHIYGLLKGYS